jgi:hypothetical protein
MTRSVLTGLLIPAAAHRAVRLCSVQDCAVAISDAIGGHLLDDAITAVLPDGVLAAFYLAEDRLRLADNPRFAVLLARLGLHERAFQHELRGDVLILGCTDGFRDVDVPPQVVGVCARRGIGVYRSIATPS